jgi:hypothetical protein
MAKKIQYKVDFYQTVYLGSQIVEAEDRKQAISDAEDMNWKAGIGLKWTDSWEAEIDKNHDYIFICNAHSKEECEDDSCWEEYEKQMEDRYAE